MYRFLPANLSLPIELLRVILSNISADLVSIQSCALVCRAWLPDARRLLFRNIKVHKYSDVNNISSILQTSPEIGCCVKQLDLKIYNDYNWVRQMDKEKAYSLLSDYAPTSLESLKLEMYEIERVSDTSSFSSSVSSRPMYIDPVLDLESALCKYPARLPNLKKFTARVSLLKPSNSRKIAWLSRAMANLPPSIEEIHIEVLAEGIDASFNRDHAILYWNRIDWAAIDEVVDLERFPYLRRVTVTFGIHFHYRMELREWVLAQLVGLELVKDGLLGVEVRVGSVWEEEGGSGGRPSPVYVMPRK